MAEASYALDDGSVVRFEFDEPPGFKPVSSAGDLVGEVRDAIGPAVDAAQLVLDRARASGPQEVSVTFGIKVTGSVNWVVAKTAADATFEVQLTWKPDQSSTGGRPAEG